MSPSLPVDALSKAIDGDPWYGSSTCALIDDLSARQAAARPIPDGHTIWEVVLHIISWQNEVERRLGGAEPKLPIEGDWPAVDEVSDSAWRRTRDELLASGNRLEQCIRMQDADVWSRQVGGERAPETGTGVTCAEMVVGLVQHNAYHTGQIGLLRKLLVGAGQRE